MNRPNSEIMVSNSFAIVTMFAIVLFFVVKPLYDLYNSKQLSIKEKTFFYLAIILLPGLGAYEFYFYIKNFKKNENLH